MKKEIFFVLFFMSAYLFSGNVYGNEWLHAVSFGANNPSAKSMSTGINDLASAKQYLEKHFEELDPIEGLYSVSIQTTVQVIDYVETDSKQVNYAIVKRGKAYAVVGFPNGKTFKSIEIERIGETNAYNFIIRYSSGDKSYNRLFLESQYAFTVSNVKEPYGSIKYRLDEEIADISTVTFNFEFIKDYPTRSMYESVITKKQPDLASGTGFALGNGYVVTNHHVIDGAKGISVKGIKGIMNSGYAAEVVASDKVNDIAILKIADYRFDGFGTIPYSVSTRMADVGEEVFVLGYPLTQALGNEIKLTNGIVSSRTGYQGDVSTYQMSAPVQPGNSGGPMFDSKGNIIGIVVAGVPGAENVGYAIKTSYLKILIESAGLNVKLPSKNSISALSLSEKVKRVKNMVLYIECGR